MKTPTLPLFRPRHTRPCPCPMDREEHLAHMEQRWPRPTRAVRRIAARINRYFLDVKWDNIIWLSGAGLLAWWAKLTSAHNSDASAADALPVASVNAGKAVKTAQATPTPTAEPIRTHWTAFYGNGKHVPNSGMRPYGGRWHKFGPVD